MSKKFYSNNGKYQNHGKMYGKRRRKNGWLKIILLSLCAVMLLAVLGVAGFLLHNEKSEKDFRTLAEQVQETAPPAVVTETVRNTATSAEETQSAQNTEALAEATEPGQNTETPTEKTESSQNTETPAETTKPVRNTEPAENDHSDDAETVEEVVSKDILPQYESLYAQNNELFGWITIPDTGVDYPVMYTPGESEKYLHMAFDGSYSYAGTPFVDINCQPDSQNLLIYGHNMSNGTMFHNLLNFQEKTYWEKHPTITFNTLYEENEYEIVAAFYDRVYRVTETDVFKFYYFIDPETEEEFDNGIREMKAKSVYDTGVEVEYGDKLITLVTCAYHTTHGRFVVLARRT